MCLAVVAVLCITENLRMELVALSIPWLLLIIIALTIVSLALRKWKLSFSFLFFALICNWYCETMPVNVCRPDSATSEALTVMSFNCNIPPALRYDTNRRNELIKLIEEESPDIFFLTENYVFWEDSLWIAIQDQYPYRTKQYNFLGNYFYSKYPIIEEIEYDGRSKHNIFCQIDYKGSLIDLFGVHFSSNNYNAEAEYLTPDNVQSRNEIKAYLKNIMNAGKRRREEARQVVATIDSLVHQGRTNPTLVMGDFNDVGGSPTLRILEYSGLKDSWWKGGVGYGATIHKPLPYRIDHIMYDDQLKLESIRRINTDEISDHHSLVAKFLIKR